MDAVSPLHLPHDGFHRRGARLTFLAFLFGLIGICLCLGDLQILFVEIQKKIGISLAKMVRKFRMKRIKQAKIEMSPMDTEDNGDAAWPRNGVHPKWPIFMVR